ncbi:hypothetical protein J8J27_32605, partial [Mycobacterium tuberculosis]|nr:hypothetical protein [Mycobacterium tuberculosis]
QLTIGRDAAGRVQGFHWYATAGGGGGTSPGARVAACSGRAGTAALRLAASATGFAAGVISATQPGSVTVLRFTSLPTNAATR